MGQGHWQDLSEAKEEEDLEMLGDSRCGSSSDWDEGSVSGLLDVQDGESEPS